MKPYAVYVDRPGHPIEKVGTYSWSEALIQVAKLREWYPDTWTVTVTNTDKQDEGTDGLTEEERWLVEGIMKSRANVMCQAESHEGDKLIPAGKAYILSPDGEIVWCLKCAEVADD